MITVGHIWRLFLHLGLTAYGGLAMVEPIRRRVVEDQGWLRQQDFLDGLALCQLLPGATVVQLATYVGYRLRGAPGALAAAAAFILPAFVLMLGLSYLYFQYGEISYIKSLSRGLGAVVIALLLQALWGLGQAVRRHWLDVGVALLALAALWGRVNYLAVFLGAGLLRLLLELRINPGETGPHRASPPAGPRPRVILTQAAACIAGMSLLTWGLWHLDQLLGRLALIFLKIGAVSFGGGYVMIPILQWEVVDHWGWLTLRQFLDGILLGYATPGPLIILSAFVGYAVKGPVGGLTATAAVFFPPMLMVIFLTPFYQQVKETRWMRPFIQGILAALVGMLALVTAEMGRTALTDWPSLAIMAASTAALIYFRLNLLWVIAGAGVCAFLIY